MAPVVLECPNAECTLGTSGAKYKTPEVEVDLHVQQNHAQGQVVAAAPSKNMRERQKKPTAEMEMTEARWQDFENQWARYKRASGVKGHEVVDDLVLCLSDALRL